jgi:serine protease Do
VPVLPGTGTPDIATLVAKVTPAVVNITTIHEVKAPRSDFDFPFGIPFGPFGGGRQGPHGNGDGDEVYKQKALGSGFIVDSQGHVVTNAHVVEDADMVRVKLADGRDFDAKVRGRDKRLDLAVLDLVGAKELPSVSLGSSEALRVGDYVVAIGNPFGLGNTVTAGIVSAKGRSIGAGPYDDFIQTDASINPGNSGGPLFNLQGQVVGIDTAINPNGQGIGFAIPVDALKDVLPQLVATGHVSRGRLGVLIQPVDEGLAKALGLDHPKGALIAEVEPGSPADKAGLRAGDLVVSVDNAEVHNSDELPRLVARHRPGSKVSLQVTRDRATRTMDVTLDQLQEEAESSEQGPGGGPSAPSSPSSSSLGIGVANTPDGVMVESVRRGGAAEGQLTRGDVIVEVNRAPVKSADELARRIQAAPGGQPLFLKVRREGKTRFVAIEMQKH